MDGSHHQVYITLPAPRIIKDEDFGTLHPEVWDWLRSIRGGWDWVHTRPVHRGESLIIRFTDPNDALLFKLTWGGS